MSLAGAFLLPVRALTALVRPAGSLVRRGDGAASVAAVPRLVAEMADDVHSMAISTRELTQTIHELARIERRVGTLEVEVARMRAAVEAMGTDVGAIHETTQPLARVAGLVARRRRA